MCQEGVSISFRCDINSDCYKWCPRVLNIFCCCKGKDKEESSDIKKQDIIVNDIGKKLLITQGEEEIT